jgi:SAM-dependent methyltransferase
MAVSAPQPTIDCATAYTLEFVRSALPPNARHILEVGCGEGALAAALAQAGWQVVAIDNDPQSVAGARRRGVDARVAEWPDFTDGGFDAVLFTRSLHHVRELDASVAAAFSALSASGRIVVEDFLAEGAPARSEAWFSSFALLLHQAGLLPKLTDLLEQRLGPTPRHDHDQDHDLHASTAIERALASGGTVRCENAAYYFRYLIPALDGRDDLAEALLSHERELIAAKLIDPLGRRYIATPVG